MTADIPALNDLVTADPTRQEIPALLQDLVLDSSDVKEFLNDLAVLAASHLAGPQHDVLCGITLLRPRRTGTVASSSPQAQSMDEIQYAFGDGPCLTAARTSVTVYVQDTGRDSRWPEYHAATVGQGIRSVLAVPIPLEGNAACGLNLYSTAPDAFDEGDREAAALFARDASRSLRLAIRIANLTETGENLKAAMDSRTTIDLAVGIIMAQNRCSQEAAMTILKAASSARNIKLRDVAAAVVASTGGSAPTTHFDS
ncbi:GAF and ANTAR domain-containing protein [uncultured Arthrobacter sp.]|uniref:GAF and ANTAR domain-containing protein n=1 Tax=uncultured Arthrobacter sp. TaxID=114050 RepID=UPI0025F3AEE6|nr:GAF and ANTAR domain-containing protein [uncultured Arthrobacter sp.]